MNQLWGVETEPDHHGRRGGRPVAVLDIGSNSVRLVVYERHARALTPLYNEKSAAALGRGLAATGKIAPANMERALTAMQRFALVARLMQVEKVHILATSAVRDAKNSAGFVESIERIMGEKVRVLSGEEEAHFAALGVVAGMPEFDGVVGDQGGGSLELSSLASGHDLTGETHELGVIRLQDDSGGSAGKAQTLARTRLKRSKVLKKNTSKVFCAIGGTWRSFAKMLQVRSDYPLHMVQNYSVAASEVLKLCDEVIAAAAAGKPIPFAETVSSSRRDLVPYCAAVMGELIRIGGFESVVFSALGVREGYLYSLLDAHEQAVDPLLQASEEINELRSRAPAHAVDLMAFSSQFMAAAGVEETAGQRRLRQVACYLADIGWRGHPDYRGEQSVDMVAYGSVVGVDHPGRAFLAQVLAVRYMGLKYRSESQDLLALAGEAGAQRARLLGALMRVAYPMSAAMPGVLPRTGFDVEAGVLNLNLPVDLAFLDGEHLQGRLEQLAGVAGFKKSAVRLR
ncbi:MAG TPA: Ppx/GppA phosphatase family protein [Devosia sp.]|nr:Ppx/GppA phosphatase family protein [Devosia sp.]